MDVLLLTDLDDGLATEERDMIAGACGKGVLKVLFVAICSLAGGIRISSATSYSVRCPDGL